jgi:integrase
MDSCVSFLNCDDSKFVPNREGFESSHGCGACMHSAGQARAGVRLLPESSTTGRLYELVEDELIAINPVGRGRYTASKHFGARGRRGLIPRFRRLPWIPTEEQWASLLTVTCGASLRNGCMLAFSYDAALRRKEVCQLRSDDLLPAHRLLRIRAETTSRERRKDPSLRKPSSNRVVAQSRS